MVIFHSYLYVDQRLHQKNDAPFDDLWIWRIGPKWTTENPWQLPGAKAYLKLHVDQQKPYVAEYS